MQLDEAIICQIGERKKSRTRLIARACASFSLNSLGFSAEVRLEKENGWDKPPWIVAHSTHVSYPTHHKDMQHPCQSATVILLLSHAYKSGLISRKATERASTNNLSIADPTAFDAELQKAG